MVSEKNAKNHIHRPTHYGETDISKIENLVIFDAFWFKNINGWYFQFATLKYFGYRLSCLKMWHISVSYCWNYGPSNLLFWFTWYSWQQVNNRQSKTAAKLIILFLKGTFNSSDWCKFEVSWPADRKMTVLWNFCKIERKGHFMGNFWQVQEIWELRFN